MLVFRCECDTVLGVDNESSKGGLGECPSCGKIIRVPAGLVNAAGKLRLASPPQRASGSYRLIKDVKPEGAKNGPGSGLGPAVPPLTTPVTASKPPSGIHAPMPTHVPAPETMAEDLAEPETLAPLTDSALNRPVTDSTPVPAVEAGDVSSGAPTETMPPAPPPPNDFSTQDTAIRTKDSLGKKPTRSTRIVGNGDLNDPNAAVETRDRNLAAAAATAITPALGASSRRRRAEAAAPPAQKSPLFFAIIGVVAVGAILLILWMLGIIGGEPKSNNAAPNKVPAVKSDTSDKKSDTKASVTNDKPVDSPKPPDANDQKPPADGEKKDDK